MQWQLLLLELHERNFDFVQGPAAEGKLSRLFPTMVDTTIDRLKPRQIASWRDRNSKCKRPSRFQPMMFWVFRSR